MMILINPFKVLASFIASIWNITPGDTTATVVSSPNFNSTPWSVTPGDGQATINTFPG